MRARRDSLIPLALAIGCYVLALAQRPGLTVADTKVDLQVDPGSFLGHVLGAWTPSTSLGHIWAGQYGGYLWPMGPFFALGEKLGLEPWVVGRLWLGTLLALSAWGMVRLLDAFLGRPRGVAHAVAALTYVLNPYVVTYAGRTSITLLAYAALPWLLLCVHRGLRDPRGWWWPAAFALVVTSIGGGVNVAVTAWVLLGPVLLVVYELLLGDVRPRDAWSLAWRTAAIGLATSLWWLAAVMVHAHYGVDFLPFTEQPGTIWSTTSISESLRGLGFWTSYIGIGYTGLQRPFQADAAAYLKLVPVIVASFAVPGLSLLGFAWTRRVRHAGFFLLLVLAGVLVMAVGFPEGTPLRHAATFTYNNVQPVQFLRTTYKAGSLVQLGIAGLAGLAAAAAWAALRSAPRRALGAAAVLGLLALAAWPFARGVGVDRQLGFDHIPAAWTGVARDLDRTLPRNARAMVLPGSLFGAYDWGGTYDPILPALTDRPVAVRVLVPFSDLRAYDLQRTTDALVGQRRAVPGQLRAMLDLQGVGAVVAGADDDRSRGGGPSQADTAGVLADAGLRGASAAFGAVRSVAPGEGSLAARRRLPQVRAYALPTRGIVRVLPRGPQTIVDGSAQGIAGLAAFGALPRDRIVRQAGDLTARELRAAGVRGADVVISDSDRRRVFVAARGRGTSGWTFGPRDAFSQDATQLNAFPDRGGDAQTVALLGGGVRSVTAPFSPGFAQFPERRPFAALDGDPSTAWLADRALAVSRRELTVVLDRRRDVPYIDLLPFADGRGVPDRVSVNGHSFAVRQGWNHLPVRLGDVDRVVVNIDHVRLPELGKGGAGGIRELRIPGVHATEALRPPVLAERALRGADLARTDLTYLLDRTTGDDPSRPRVVTGDRQRGLVRDQQDGELGWRRVIEPPVARRWRAEALVRIAPATPDHVIDRLAGPAAFVVDGSSRFEGRPRNRSSSAFDGDPGRAWIAGWTHGTGAWLRWTLARPVAVRRLRLDPVRVRVRRPTRVRLDVDDRLGTPVGVQADGAVVLPRPVRGRRFTLHVLDARFPAGTPGLERRRRAVGIGEVRAPGIPYVIDDRVAGPRRFASTCKGGPSLRAGAATVHLRVRLTLLARFDAGLPVRAVSCDRPVPLPARRITVAAPVGPWLLDHVRLTSPAPRGLPPATGSGAVVDPGTPGRSTWKDVRLRTRGATWLVLGTGFSDGWRATCDGRDLGTPKPVQGYANGWALTGSCTTASFRYAPSRVVLIAAIASLAACLLALAFLVVRRRRGGLPPAPDALDEAPVAPWPIGRALAAGLAAAAVLGVLFALRAGVVLGPVVALILWRGIGARALALAGGALVVLAVPLASILAAPLPDTGFQTSYAVDRIAAHWIALLAVVLLGAALARALWRARA